ncbi:MAG: mannose-1-phosphate guanylyltransferase [Kiritimatiellaeota bacterium]|nr:mannose-1-phosphate guanylyltransferase [Kiritimatiellota bacterium]
MPNSAIFAVIMAGGKGERFWPQSRAARPKQLLRLIGDLTLIEQTVARLTPLVPPSNIIVVTNEDYVSPMRELLDIPNENIVGEPIGRDTAPCVALAAALVASKTDDPNAVMLVLPADHVIKDKEALNVVLSDCAKLAASGKIVTIGVNPTFPSTGYGYIKCGAPLSVDCATTFYESAGFREKPDSETARAFIEAACYKWNSGMFAWSVSTIFNAFEKYAPNLENGAKAIIKSIEKNTFEDDLKPLYASFEKISVDYAIMEKVDNVVVAECAFDWDDVGSWTALRNQLVADSDGNVVKANHIGVNTKNSIIVGESPHLIATIDIDDLIIVHTDDATLVCRSKSAQRVKEIVHKLADDDSLKEYL